jgi:hypothetical protein
MATTRVASLTSEGPSLRKSVVPVVDHDHESHQGRMGLVPLREVGQAATAHPSDLRPHLTLLELSDNTSIITCASFSCTLHHTSSIFLTHPCVSRPSLLYWPLQHLQLQSIHRDHSIISQTKPPSSYRGTSLQSSYFEESKKLFSLIQQYIITEVCMSKEAGKEFQIKLILVTLIQLKESKAL